MSGEFLAKGEGRLWEADSSNDHKQDGYHGACIEMQVLAVRVSGFQGAPNYELRCCNFNLSEVWQSLNNCVSKRREAVLIGCMTAQTEHICGYGKQVLVVRECLCKGLCCRVGKVTFTPFSQAIPLGNRAHMRLFNGSCIFRSCCYGGLEEVCRKARRQGGQPSEALAYRYVSRAHHSTDRTHMKLLESRDLPSRMLVGVLCQLDATS